MVIRVNYKKNSYLNNYPEKLFCQANCFNFQSNQDSIFIKHIKFEKRKAISVKNISEELMAIVWHCKRWWNFSMSEDDKKEK